MIIKLLLKIWPALLPIVIYLLWLLVRAIARKIAAKNLEKKSGKIIDATYEEFKNGQKIDSQIDDKIGDFSLHNHQFVKVLYLSFVIAIICFLFFAIRVPHIEKGEYVPAHIENGEVIPAKIIEK